MEEILHHLGCIKLVNNGINCVSTGAGFLPSKSMKPQKLPEQSPHSARKALNRHLDRIYPFDLGQFVSGIFTREAHFPEIFNNYHPLVVTIDQKCF